MARTRKKNPEPTTITQTQAVLRPGDWIQSWAKDSKSEGMFVHKRRNKMAPTGSLAETVTPNLVEVITPCVPADPSENIPFLIGEQPYQGRPFKAQKTQKTTEPKLKELEEPLAFVVNIIGDFAEAEIKGNTSAHTKNRKLAEILDAVTAAQKHDNEKAFTYELSTKTEEIKTNHARQVGTQLRRLLRQCVPETKHEIIRDAIHGHYTALTIEPALQFRHKDTRRRDGVLHENIPAPNTSSQYDVWIDKEEKETVEHWFGRRVKTLGAKEIEGHISIIKKLFGRHDD